MSNDSNRNVLLTCAGRRNYLVGYFREALAGRGQVHAADANPHAVALQEADVAWNVPPVDAPEYVEALLRICRKARIRLLIPLNDLELPVLAAARDRFLEAGTIAIVSSPDVVEIAFDKWTTVQFLQANGFQGPRTWLSPEAWERDGGPNGCDWPLVLKPRWGSASIGIEIVHDRRELELAWELLRRKLSRTILAGASAKDPDRAVLIQERLRGEEHGLDVVNDLTGQPRAVFARRKLAMRAGETDRVDLRTDPRLLEVGLRLGERLGHIGNLDCDVFVDGEAMPVMEFNPRFGGGYPFSQVAGANLPAALLAWAEGKEADPSWLRVRADGIVSKCDRLLAHSERSRIGPV